MNSRREMRTEPNLHLRSMSTAAARDWVPYRLRRQQDGPELVARDMIGASLHQAIKTARMSANHASPKAIMT